ncbi:MAG: enoyl-CoA hydratase/isomerase family protein [Gammaproteobacteria bacterium]|nr:enoyl-CoA hydratase/isomerase family protein [Gammaproteobacteria bacterium]
MKEYQTLTVEVDSGRVEVGLNRPLSLNAISPDMCLELMSVMSDVQADASTRVIVLYGHGRMFSSGGDLKAEPVDDSEQVLETIYKPALLSIVDSRVPVIAAVHGGAVGVAAALMMSCDLVVMADTGFVMTPFVKLGLIPDGGVSWHLQRYIGKQKAAEAIFGGEKIPAETCLGAGMVNRVVDEARVVSEARTWADDIAALPPLAVAAGKATLNYSATNNLPDSMAFEAKLQKELVASHDAQEGIAAFKEKRQPKFKGH